MHQLPINASIQLIPINQADTAMAQIDGAIAIVQQSGLAYEVGPFGTSICGSYAAVMELIATINSYMANSSPTEWLLQVQLHIHPTKGVLPEEKTAKHR